MKTIFFNEKILGPLEEWAHLGETKNDMGTRLIGHAPHIAPKAYVNVVYPPLGEDDLEEFSQRLGKPMPEQFKEFLLNANGLNVFSDALRVMGYRPLKRKPNAGVYDYASCIMTANAPRRINGVREQDTVVAWYKVDGSYVLLDESGKAVRFDPRDGGRVIQEWPDFDTWLSSEIAVLNEKYKTGEISIFIPSNQKK
jgi:hypothetical protein